MILTPEQVAIRRVFRTSVLKHWRTSFYMTAVVGDVADSINGAILPLEGKDFFVHMNEVLGGIPSIGKFFWKSQVRAWLASHYPRTSQALFDGKTDEEVMTVWNKEKRTAIARKRDADRIEFTRDKKVERSTKFIFARSLDKRSDWHTVK